MKRKSIIILIIILMVTIPIVFSVFYNDKGLVIEVKKNKKLGFLTNYYIYIPKGINKSQLNYILVEPNNTGKVSDDHLVHEKNVLKKIELGFSRQIADELKVPLLIPVFDRLESNWKMYTHALDRDTLQNKDGDLRRIDLQLLNMVDDATQILRDKKIKVSKKFLLTGFSASGNFVNRFAVLHPERVQSVVAGGVNCMPILPEPKLGDEKLIYPIGIYDIEEISGQKFDFSKYSQIPQYIYMGSDDENDTLFYDDAFSDKERKLIISVLGIKMHDRWKISKEVYRKLGLPVELVMYKGIGHKINNEVKNDIILFLKRTIN